MDIINNLINNITRVLEVALQETCLDRQFFTYTTGYQCVCIQSSSVMMIKGKVARIDLQTSVGDDGYWDKEIQIWTTEPDAVTTLHQCQITKLIDALMNKKKVLSK